MKKNVIFKIKNYFLASLILFILAISFSCSDELISPERPGSKLEYQLSKDIDCNSSNGDHQDKRMIGEDDPCDCGCPLKTSNPNSTPKAKVDSEQVSKM
jgi:hypothetical protein